MIMSYAILQPPFTLKFREMTKKELKAYFDWFLSQVPSRIGELERAVKEEDSLVAWSADKSPESLATLGDWFAQKVETRRRTADEITELSAASSFPIVIPDHELTNRTFSLAMDVGMYFAECLQVQCPRLEWQQPLNDPKFIDYGQPVLIGFGPVPLNPVRILINLAYGIADKKQDGGRLRALYDYWSKQAGNAKR